MMTQLRTVSMFSSKSSFNIYGSKEHPQLALPKKNSVIVSEHKATINESVSWNKEFILLTGIKDDLNEFCSAYMPNVYLLPGYPALPTVVMTGAMDKTRFTRLFKPAGKFFN